MTPTPIRPTRSPGLRRIVVALDGTPESETILRHLRDLLGMRPVVVMIHVLPDSEGRQERDAIRYLSDLQGRFPEFRSRWIVESGDPAERILEAARDEDADALALTTHARGGVASLLLGGVAREVVRSAGRPVFLVRPGVTPLRRAGRRILVPLTEFPGHDPVPPIVEKLARETNAEVRLIHVIPFPRVADPVTGFNPAVLRPLELPAVSWLGDCADELMRREIRTTRGVVAGVPDEAILREGRDENADLIVLQPRRRLGLSRLIAGSVTESVLKRADRAVLICRRGGAEPA